MIEMISNYLTDLLKKQSSRRKIAIADLEAFIKGKYGDGALYQLAGGYRKMSRIITDYVGTGRLEPVKSAKGNGREPELKTMYWAIPERITPLWPNMDIVRLSDILNLAAYTKQPELQTDEEWQLIQNVYEFLRSREQREWVTREERSLELFESEKWLSEEQGLNFIRRISVSLEDLKAIVHGEPFVFWSKTGIRLDRAEQVLIVENLSLFHTLRRVLEKDGHAFGLRPDLLIYGEGKKIEASLSFLNDIAEASRITVRYAGDIDPEGWGIYVRLKRKYVEFRIHLAVQLYEAMVQLQKTVLIGMQTQDDSILHAVLAELRSGGSSAALDNAIVQCWRQRVRIPQEVLTVETICRMHGEKDVTKK